MNNYVVSFVHTQCVATYGDTEVTVQGQWKGAAEALAAVVAKFGDGLEEVIATEQPIHVFNSDSGTSHYYAYDLEAEKWERTY